MKDLHPESDVAKFIKCQNEPKESKKPEKGETQKHEKGEE